MEAVVASSSSFYSPSAELRSGVSLPYIASTVRRIASFARCSPGRWRSCGSRCRSRRVDRARAGGNEASGSPFLPFLSPLWCHRLPPWPRWPPWDAGPGLLCAGCSTHSGGAPPPPPCCRPQVSAASYGAASSLQPVPKLSIPHPISHLAPHLAPSNLRPAEAEAAFWTDGTRNHL